MEENISSLYEKLVRACQKGYAAIRSTVELEPAGGPGDKVFPPTYVGGLYAVEKRRLGNEVVDAVILDSVQSQANRFEDALQRAHDNGLLDFPLPQIDFDEKKLEGLGLWLPAMRLTALQVPHRIADAYFNESRLNGKDFRKSPEGKQLWSSHVGNATAVFRYCPTSLIFGMWDSHGPRGGMGTKFPRSLASEIVGYSSVTGYRTGGRIDPMHVSAGVKVYAAEGEEEWTVDESKAKKDEKGNPKSYGVEGKPSELGFGNVTPDFARWDVSAIRGLGQQVIEDEQIGAGRKMPGGVTIHHAVQTTVLSLAGLRRLRFPTGKGSDEGAEASARAVLASLALAAVALQREEGYFLRSRCDLRPLRKDAPSTFEFVPLDGSPPEPFRLEREMALNLFRHAVESMKKHGLDWGPDLRLEPKEEVYDLLKKSMEQMS